MKRLLILSCGLVFGLALAGACYLALVDDPSLYYRKFSPGHLFHHEAAAPSPDALMQQARDAFLGRGTAQNEEKGAALMQQAALAGDKRAAGLVGILYMGGIGLPQDFDSAGEWFARAGDKQSMEMAEHLMQLRAIGETIPPEQAAQQKEENYKEARAQLRPLFMQMLQDGGKTAQP